MGPYYTLVAGLRELSLSEPMRGFDAEAEAAEVHDSVSRRDQRLVELLDATPATHEEWEEWYAECARSHSAFLRRWAAFDRDVRNIGAALSARRLGLQPASQTVGEGFVTESIARSAAADFGLRGELDYVDKLMSAVAEGGDIVEKERTIDRLRWEMADEITTFNYFDIDAVLAWLVKAAILRRWAALGVEQGAAALAAIASVESGV